MKWTKKLSNLWFRFNFYAIFIKHYFLPNEPETGFKRKLCPLLHSSMLMFSQGSQLPIDMSTLAGGLE